MKKAGDGLYKLVLDIAGFEHRHIVTIALSWKSIVGSLLAERSFVYKLEDNVLFVAVTSSVLMTEMVLNKQMIMEKIEKIAGVKLDNVLFFVRSKKGKQWLK
jgi:predicted nucleic acid-binding Zn ribbon protein